MSDINVIIGAPQNISVVIKNETEFIIKTNEQGPQGIPGPQGGIGGSGPRNYTHEQSTASGEWTISHNLGFRPAGIQVVDYQGNYYQFFPVEHIDSNTCKLYFGYSISGFAYLS